MRFYKSCSGGNDFLLVDSAELDASPSPQRIRNWCHRHRGPGADGLVVYDRSVDPVSFRIFNQDGLEAELSGNGMAGLTSLLVQLELAGGTVDLEAKAGRFRHRVLEHRGTEFHLEIDLGVPDFHDIRLFPFLSDYPKYPVEKGIGYKEFRFFPVAVGNPQVVLFKSPDRPVDEMMILAEELHRQPVFPFRTNVSIVDEGGDEETRVYFYERGVGPTESSSTGSAGAFAVMRARRPGLSRVRFLPPGGEPVKVSGEDRIYLENRTRMVYKGECWEFADV